MDLRSLLSRQMQNRSKNLQNRQRWLVPRRRTQSVLLRSDLHPFLEHRQAQIGQADHRPLVEVRDPSAGSFDDAF